jgi:hypothetical protein
MKNALRNTMAMFLENDDDFTINQKIEIMNHLHNSIYVATNDTQVAPLPNRIALLGNVTTTGGN